MNREFKRSPISLDTINLPEDEKQRYLEQLTDDLLGQRVNVYSKNSFIRIMPVGSEQPIELKVPYLIGMDSVGNDRFVTYTKNKISLWIWDKESASLHEAKKISVSHVDSAYPTPFPNCTLAIATRSYTWLGGLKDHPAYLVLIDWQTGTKKEFNVPFYAAQSLQFINDREVVLRCDGEQQLFSINPQEKTWCVQRGLFSHKFLPLLSISPDRQYATTCLLPYGQDEPVQTFCYEFKNNNEFNRAWAINVFRKDLHRKPRVPATDIVLHIDDGKLLMKGERHWYLCNIKNKTITPLDLSWVEKIFHLPHSNYLFLIGKDRAIRVETPQIFLKEMLEKLNGILPAPLVNIISAYASYGLWRDAPVSSPSDPAVVSKKKT